MVTCRLQFGVVELVLGNIVDQDTDAIVNAANTKLAGGGGVDGAIHRAAGPQLKKFCLELPVDDSGQRCRTGHVVTTPAFELSAKCIIHAVGPFFNEKYAAKANDQLRQVHTLALQSAVEHKCSSIAFPAISTGAYRFPVRQAAEIAVDVACNFLNGTLPLSADLKKQASVLKLIRFVLFKQNQLEAFQAALVGEQGQVDWSGLKSGSGRGTQVPYLLQQLNSEDRDIQLSAYESLYNELVHQGHVYEAAVYALPTLRALLTTSQEPLRQGIVVLISEIGTGMLPIHAVQNDGSNWRMILHETGRSLEEELAREEIVGEQIKQEVLKCLPEIAVHIADPDPFVRRVVGDVLSIYPEAHNFALPVLLNAIGQESTPNVREEFERYIARLRALKVKGRVT